MSKSFVKHGIKYKCVKVFKRECDAEDYVDSLGDIKGSKRLAPIIDRHTTCLMNEHGFWDFFSWTRFRVYVPVIEKGER